MTTETKAQKTQAHEYLRDRCRDLLQYRHLGGATDDGVRTLAFALLGIAEAELEAGKGDDSP